MLSEPAYCVYVSEMLNLDSPAWEALSGGYQLPFNASLALKALYQNENDEDAWTDLWDNLHHQGDVGSASYAAVPHLVKLQFKDGSTNWQFMGLVSTIEYARRSKGNSEIPDELRDSYLVALEVAARNGGYREPHQVDEDYLLSHFCLVASINNQMELAGALLQLDRGAIVRPNS